MPSELRIFKTLEWFTELPLKDHPRKSSVFSLYGYDFFFQFIFQVMNAYPYTKSCNLYLESTSEEDIKFNPCNVKFEAGFKNQETLNLGNSTFVISEGKKKSIWDISLKKLQPLLPADFMDGLASFFRSGKNRPEEIGFFRKDDKSVQTPLYIDTNFLLEGISKDLSTLFDGNANHDVEFICGDEAIKAHKNVLCCRSEVFATMLRTEMAEGKTGQIKIQDIECTVFKQFLKYLYTGVLPELTVDTSLQIYEAADKYAVSALKKQCASFLVEHLSPENACEILIISDRHSDSDFKKSVIEYVLEKEIPFEGETLTKFCKENAPLAAEVLNLFCLHRREKNTVS